MNTDNIVAALAHCIHEVGCDECPYYSSNEGCFTKLMKNSLELIKLQNKRLTIIADIAYDYDGFSTIVDLKNLIDEIKDIARGKNDKNIL